MTAEPLPPSAIQEVGLGERLRLATELLRTLTDEVPAGLHDVAKADPEFRRALLRLAAEPSQRLRLVGKARKVSVSMPEDLTAAVQERVGRGEFSHYVTEAVARQLELDLLDELLALLEAEYGPIPEEALTEARNAWPDAQ